jgi:hypothetical protein
MSKCAMSMYTLGMAEEFQSGGIPNSLWPQTMFVKAIISNNLLCQTYQFKKI